MATATATVNLTNPDNEDRTAFKFVVDAENARRAAAVPPETLLPNSTANERKQSAELIYAQRMIDVHRSYIQQADQITKQEFLAALAAAPEAKRTAALAAGYAALQ